LYYLSGAFLIVYLFEHNVVKSELSKSRRERNAGKWVFARAAKLPRKEPLVWGLQGGSCRCTCPLLAAAG